MNPSEYIERIDSRTGRLVAGQIDAHELLAGAPSAYRFRYKDAGIGAPAAERIVRRLRADAAHALANAVAGDRLAVLVTGGTGFVGKEILVQAARDADIAQVVVLVRPKVERASGRVLSVASRGEALLAQLRLTPRQRGKFRFVAGDVEQPGLGIAEDVAQPLRRELTHVVHCAANVAFDDTYERSFRANVVAGLNALHFSRRVQDAAGSRFVAHVAVGTSYLHGRCGESAVQEDALAFPAGRFNNYYELTKAIAALETRSYVLKHGLRAIELCPAIVIGDPSTGNNRGDTKVVNAPLNFLGRVTRWPVGARALLRFPAHPDAQLNVVTVDRVAKGILAALKKPQAVGLRIHLASDTRLSAAQMARVMGEELGAEVRLLDPALHRRAVLPIACALLRIAGRGKMARRLYRLGTVFAGYSEAGQPLHAVSNDVAVLGLPAQRPAVLDALRMLCRHNEWVQEFGDVRDPEEIARREDVWQDLVARIEAIAKCPAARIAPADFRRMAGCLLGVPAAGSAAEPRARAAALSPALLPGH